MEIKKADSKGRVSGFEPGEHYMVDRDAGGFQKLVIVAPDGRPFEDALREAMEEFHSAFAKIAYKVVD